MIIEITQLFFIDILEGKYLCIVRKTSWILAILSGVKSEVNRNLIEYDGIMEYLVNNRKKYRIYYEKGQTLSEIWTQNRKTAVRLSSKIDERIQFYAATA